MKKIVFILVLLFVDFIGFSQIEFEENIVIDNSEAITNLNSSGLAAGNTGVVDSADIDGDGKDDIIVISSNDLSWYRRISGSDDFFGTKQIINPNQVNFFTSTDIDGDGDVDIVTNNDNGNLSWFENDGVGNFTVHQMLNSSLIQVIHLTDIDDDGDMDLIVSIANSSNTSSGKIFLNINTNGDFSEQHIIEDNYYEEIASISSADFDNDGDMDIVTASRLSSGRLAWYKNLDGNSNFDSRISINSATLDLQEVYTGDIDNDGFIDIVVNDFIDGLYWYKNNGNSFAKRTISSGVQSSSTKIIDLDNDGDLDLLMESNLGLYGYFNSGNGFFGSKHIQNRFTTGTIDINQDGILEIISNIYTFIQILKYDVSTYPVVIEYIKTIKPQVQGTKNIKTADIDGDGDLDIISSDENKHGLFWFENIDGRGEFITRLIDVYSTEEFVIGDIDNDGDLDIIYDTGILYDGNRRVYYVSKNDGAGNFEVAEEIHTNNTAIFKSPFFLDIDNDGDKDLIYATDKIYWHENINGSFGEFQVLFDLDVSSIEISDIDNDGDIDLLVTIKYDDTVIWLDNDGLYNFTQNIITNSLYRTDIALAFDIDGDGDKDVVSAVNFVSDKKIVWFENLDGLGNFSSEIIVGNLEGSFSFLKIFDFDNDGDLDVIGDRSSGSSFGTVFWYENTDGLGNFGNQQSFYDVSYSKEMVYSDLDGDGDLDFIISKGYSPLIVWLKNLGNLDNSIGGNVFFDTGLDGCDSNDIPISNLMIQADNGNDSFINLTNEGSYLLNVNQGSFTTNIVSLPNYYSSTPSSYSHNFTNIGNTETANFCIEPNQTVDDINTSIIPLDSARPGFDVSYQLVYKNIGTTQLNGNVTLEYDNTKLTLLTTSETITSQTANSLVFDYSNLNPFESRILDLEFNVLAPPTVSINDELEFQATINPVASDETPEDNVYELNQIVVSSYDPNDIAVAEGEEILLEDADKYLHYVIRFQNTGTAHAVKVRVNNVLDNKLDWSTLQLESTSHESIVEIKNGTEIDFIFNAIYLPDSTTDEPNSHGYVAYKIKPKSTVSVGDVFVNQADIYFDFNAAITTNTVATEIVNTLGLNDNKVFNFTIYPVPTSSILKINTKSQLNKIQVYNSIGQLVLEEYKKNSINIESLKQGLYFVEVIDENNNSSTKKIVKK